MDKINVVEVFFCASRIGRIALTEQSICAFEYDTEFLKVGFSLSPYYLPLRPGLFMAKRDPFRGNFGVFDDSLPDGWGNLILDLYLRQQGIVPEKLSVLQRLALVGTTGRGALEYHPDKSVTEENAFLDFDKLATDAENILTNESSGDSVEMLYLYSGSSGGARPKIFMKIEDKYWLVKFKAMIDPPDIGRTEYAYSLLARECGVNMPETRLFENKYFGAERFDRTEKGGKIHTISIAGLVHADYRIPSLDYSVLLKVCLNLTKNMDEVSALFRLMVFNVAILNRDDHAKNFSFQYKNGGWVLSPAYDLLPSSGFNGYHTTTINGQGDPSLKDIMQVAAEAGLTKKHAKMIVEQVIETCRKNKKLNYSIK